MKSGETCNKIARAYQLDYDVLLSFIEYLAYLRNLCAHHSRVWNRKTTKTIKIPRSKPSKLIHSFNNESLSSRKLYNPLVLVVHLLKIICPDNHFKNRLITLIEKHDIPFGAMGFPNDWRRRGIWVTEG